MNPVESRMASLDKPESLEMTADEPADVARVKGFISWDETQMKTYCDSMGFAMSPADLPFCRDYFRDEEKRDPSLTELKVIDTYWSDHCRHTTFLTRLDQVDVETGPGAMPSRRPCRLSTPRGKRCTARDWRKPSA